MQVSWITFLLLLTHLQYMHLTLLFVFRMDFISLLPPEISLKILSHLNIEDIFSCSLVSKSWYDVANSNSIWKHFWNPDNPLKDSEGYTGSFIFSLITSFSRYWKDWNDINIIILKGLNNIITKVMGCQ